MQSDEELFGPELDLDDAADAFLKKYEEEVEEAEETIEEVTEEVEETAEEATEEVTDDAPEDDEGEETEAPAPKVADDDAEVTVEVDGKELKFAVKELKRLAGQEASLTQKSQAIAAQRKALDQHGLYLSKILQDRFESAKAKAEKYKDVDLFRASRELDPDEFDALRAAKESAESELKAIEREGQEFVQRATQLRSQLLREQAKESLKEITKAIPEWNDKLYGEIRTYAISQGMDADLVNEVVDPGAIVMMHKAMLFDQAQSKKETVTKKVIKAPKRALSKSAAPDRGEARIKTLKTQAARTGDIDDVTALFLAQLNSKE